MKNILMNCAAIIALSIPGVAVAQQAAASGGSSDGEGKPAAAGLNDIVVTGSRIARPNLEQPAPISTLSNETITAKASPILGEALSQLPSLGFFGGVRANSFGTNGVDAGGLDLADLHDLGTSRTLVLVDGKRHVAGSGGTAAVDLSSIPPGMVDHVEVITGGASAIYGSDAVSGVINVLTRKRFDGIAANVQSGVYDGGFGASHSGDFTVGHNFKDGNGNITFSAFGSKQQSIYARDIPSVQPNYFRILNGSDLGANGLPISGDGIPNYLIVPNTGIDVLNDTGVLLDFSNGNRPITFDAAGKLVRFPNRTGSLNFAIGSFAEQCAYCYHTTDYIQLVPSINRVGAALRFDRDIADGIKLSLDGKFIQARTLETSEAFATIGDYQLQPDNAFISPELATYLAGTSAADYPYISRALTDTGLGTTNTRRRTYRGVAQLEGSVDAGLADVRWDVSANYGVTDSRIRFSLVRTDRLADSIDSVIDPTTGQAVCRSGTAGCVPYNPFGMQNSQAAIDYLRTSGVETQRLTQLVFDANLSFDTSRFLNLPGGPIRFAAGAEYRRETSRINYDATLQSGTTNFGAPIDASGAIRVGEGYVEVEAPLLKDRPFFHELTLNGAVRVSDYSTVGGTTAWKVGGLWAPASFAKLRGTYSRAVRAPNITESFLPATSGYANVNDPCDTSAISNNPNRAANCRAAGVPASYAQTTTNIPAVTAGNANLSPEVSNSFTAGIVLQPLRNLALTADYFSIDIRDAISFVSAQNITNLCYDAAGGINNAYCALIQRDASTSRLTQVSTSYVNASRLKTNGIDAQLSYRHGAPSLNGAPAMIGLTVNGTYVFKLRNYPFQDNPNQVNVLEGTLGRPRLKILAALRYDAGRFGATWQTRYASRTARFSKDPGQAAYAEMFDKPYLAERFYHNVSLSYRVGGSDAGGDGLTLRAGVNNILNTAPPIYSLRGFGNDGVYELGRYLYVGAGVRF